MKNWTAVSGPVLLVGAMGEAAAEIDLDVFPDRYSLDPRGPDYDRNLTWEQNLDALSMGKEWALAIITTPSHVRREVCEPLVNRGIPLVVEKPLTLRWSELQWFLEVERLGAWICCIQQARFDPRVEALMDREWQTFQAWKIRKRPSDYYGLREGRQRGFLHSDGGVLAQQGQHLVDLACALLGPAIAVTCRGRNFVHKDIECEDSAFAVIKHERGGISSISATTAGPAGDTGFHLWGLNGDHLLRGSPSKTPLWQRIAQARWHCNPSPLPVREVAYGIAALHACYASMACFGIEITVPDLDRGTCFAEWR